MVNRPLQEDRLIQALQMIAPGTVLRDAIDNIVQVPARRPARSSPTRRRSGPMISGGIDIDVGSQADDPLRAVQDGRRHPARQPTAAASCTPTCSSCPMPASPPRRPAPGTAPPSAWPSRSTLWPSPSRPPGTWSRCTWATSATSWIPSGPSSTRPTRPCRPWSGSAPAGTRCPPRCRCSSSRTRSPCTTCCRVLQRTEMVLVIVQLIEGYIIQLGTEGRLVQLQLEDMLVGVREDRDGHPGRLPARCHSRPDRVRARPAARAGALGRPAVAQLRRPRSLGFGADIALDKHVRPRGFRLLRKIPRLSEWVIDAVVVALRRPEPPHRGPAGRTGRRSRRGLPAGPGDQGRAQPHPRVDSAGAHGADVPGRRHGRMSAPWGGAHPGDHRAGLPGDHRAATTASRSCTTT